jgi:hypothetical protein
MYLSAMLALLTAHRFDIVETGSFVDQCAEIASGRAKQMRHQDRRVTKAPRSNWTMVEPAMLAGVRFTASLRRYLRNAQNIRIHDTFSFRHLSH